MLSILDLLRADGSIVINKKLAKTIGLAETIIFSELISQFKYYESRGELEDGWFYCTVEKLEDSTTFSKHQQSKAINKLVDLGLIEYKQKGLPAKRWFKIDEQKIAQLLFDDKKLKNLTSDNNGDSSPQNAEKPRQNQKLKNLTSRSSKNEQLEVKKFASNNNKLNNTNLINKEDDEEDNISYSENPNFSPFQAAFVQEAQERNIPSRLIEKTLKKLGKRKYHFGALPKALDITIAEYLKGNVHQFASYFVEVLEDQEDVLRTAMNQPIKVPVEIDFPMHNWLES